MQLPGQDRAFVEPAKVRDYLLSLEHPVGRFKCRFFRGLGYSPDSWEILAEQLLSLLDSFPAEPGQPSDFGTKFETRGSLEGPSGKLARVVSVWMIRHGEDFPRFITAFPA
jgi:hypothetical protein